MFENIKMPEGINPQMLEHLMHPKNYGKLENPSGIGVAMDDKTNEYVIFYVDIENEKIKESRFATNGCQDTVVIGSMFTDMIEANDITYANSAIEKMHERLGDMTPQQRICAEIVFNSFLASLTNMKNLQNGENEELHMIKMQDSCEAVGQNKESK